jgi:hypothetical protein
VNQQLTAHPVAMLFPDIPEAAFAALLDDIRQNGVKVPILVHCGQILDGCQRYKACQILNIPCPTVRWNGRDPWMEAQSRNLFRRHLAQDQIYAICKLAAERFGEVAAPIRAEKLKAKQRQARKSRPSKFPAREDGGLLRPRDRNKESADLIGAHFGVSGTTVKRVDRLARWAPELVPKVAAGELSVTKALLQLDSPRRAFKATTAGRSGDAVHVDGQIQRIQKTLMAEWVRCPIEHRKTFLLKLQAVFREFIVERAGTTGLRPAGSNPVDPKAIKAS